MATNEKYYFIIIPCVVHTHVVRMECKFSWRNDCNLSLRRPYNVATHI